MPGSTGELSLSTWTAPRSCFHPPPAYEGGVIGSQSPIGHSLGQTRSQNVYDFLKIETWYIYHTLSESPAKADANLGPRPMVRN